MLASVVLAALLAGTASPAPAPTAIATASNATVVPPSAKALAPVIINGVLFRAVEFDTGKAVWRNLAITVAPDHIEAWRALPVPIKNSYAEQMIDTYRVGLKFSRDVKLTFVDESNATLDQYLWTPPAERK